MRKLHHFYSDHYFVNFYFCVWSEEMMRKKMNVTVAPTCNGLTLLHDDGSILIWLRSKEMLGALAHESVHAAKFAFAQKGITASNDNDEPLAYFVQYIFENCHKAILSGRSRSKRQG